MLTPKQEKFCIEYIQCGDATEAYRRSYDATGMNPNTTQRKGYGLLQHPGIKKRLEELWQPALNDLRVTQEKTLRRLMQGQEFDIRRLYHTNGQLKHPHELDDDTARAVIGVRYDKDTGLLTEYKIIDVKGCAELLGKHLKLFTEKIETTVQGGITLTISQEDAAL